MEIVIPKEYVDSLKDSRWALIKARDCLNELIENARKKVTYDGLSENVTSELRSQKEYVSECETDFEAAKDDIIVYILASNTVHEVL